MERGLTMTDLRKMQIGQIVDFCIAYNDRQNKQEKPDSGKRKATQADIDAFFG